MSPTHGRYLLLEQGVGAGVVNFGINAAIAWGMFRGAESVPLWGQQSIMGDTIGTCVMLPLLTSLIVTKVARGQMRAGKMPALGWSRATHPVLRWLPRRTVVRGLVLGALCMVAFAPLAYLYLRALEVDGMGLGRFVIWKATFAAVLGALVTPVIALWAIGEAPEAMPPPAAAPAGN
jgi:hypothetical protein